MTNILVVGSLNVDLVVDVDDMPRKGETIMGSKLTLIGGGKGANQACAASQLGNHTVMLGALGEDTYAELLLESLTSAGVDTSRLKRVSDTHTGMALISVNSRGENSITVIPGANYTVDSAYIDAHRDAIAECDAVLLQLEIPMATVVHTARIAHELGKLVILDPAPAPEQLPEELYSLVDIIKPNETELGRLTGMEITLQSLPDAADSLVSRGVKKVLVTLGAQGAFVYEGGGNGKHLPSQPVQVTDTTAAGDAFTAAMGTKLAQGASLEEAARFANCVSAIVVTRKGAQSSLPTLDEVLHTSGNELGNS